MEASVFIVVLLLANEFQVNMAEVSPPPKPVAGDHWMQTAAGGICERSPGMYVCWKEKALGMENGCIPDDSITASSYYKNRATHAPVRARLNTQGYAGAWAADVPSNDASPWIQVEFDTEVNILGLITQGRADNDQWVIEYQVAYSSDGDSWEHVTDAGGTPTTFPGNADRDCQVTNRFPAGLRTRFIRILPTDWNQYCSMRFEIVGCS